MPVVTEHPFTDTESIAVADGDDREVLRFYFEECHIGCRIGADNGGVINAVVVEGHFKALRTVDYMVVGDDISVGAKNNPGTETSLLFRAIALLPAGLW